MLIRSASCPPLTGFIERPLLAVFTYSICCGLLYVINTQQVDQADVKNKPLKEILIKSNYFKLAKTADIFHEDRYKGITIPAHFVKNSDNFFCA